MLIEESLSTTENDDSMWLYSAGRHIVARNQPVRARPASIMWDQAGGHVWRHAPVCCRSLLRPRFVHGCCCRLSGLLRNDITNWCGRIVSINYHLWLLLASSRVTDNQSFVVLFLYHGQNLYTAVGSLMNSLTLWSSRTVCIYYHLWLLLASFTATNGQSFTMLSFFTMAEICTRL